MATLDADDLAAIANLFTAGTMDMTLHRLVVANDTGDPAFSVTNSIGNGLQVMGAYGAYIGSTAYGGAAMQLQGQVAGSLGLGIYSGGGAAPAISVQGGDSGTSVLIAGPYSDPGVAVRISAAPSDGAAGGDALEIRGDGDGSHDVALTGSGDILGSISLVLTQALADVSTATVGGALNGAHATAWGKVVKDVAAKLLKVFSFGSTSVPAQVFDLDDGTNPTTRTPQ